MSLFLVSQCLAGIAVLLDIVALQMFKRHQVLMCLLLSTSLTAFHYILLAQYSGAALMALAALRYGVSIRYQRQSLMWLFTVLALVVGVALMDSPWSLLALAGSCLQTYAAFQKEQLRMRLAMLLGALSWLAYGVTAGSPVAVAMESLFLASNLVGLMRFSRSILR